MNVEGQRPIAPKFRPKLGLRRFFLQPASRFPWKSMTYMLADVLLKRPWAPAPPSHKARETKQGIASMQNSIKVAVAAALFAAAGAASASVFQIQMQGVNLTYSQAAGTICDSNTCNLAPPTSDADPLLTMAFIKDGVLQGLLTSNIQLDFFADLVSNVNPIAGQTSAINVAGTDVFDALINGGPGLQTNITSGSISFTNTGVNMTGTGFSTIFAQNLPFGVVAANPINWSFSSGNGACTGPGNNRVCTYSGTGELSWTTASVPEPVTLGLIGVALAGLGVVRRRNVK